MSIIETRYDTHDVIRQNPALPCPDEVLRKQGLLDVSYLGFDKKIHHGQIVVATEVIAELEAFFRLALEWQFPIKHVVPISSPLYNWDTVKALKDNISSGFSYRVITGTDELSSHAYGMAFDVNPLQNPSIRYQNGKQIGTSSSKRWNPKRAGTFHSEHPLVKLMEGFGWEWGGHRTRQSGHIDYQHFQKNN